MPAIKPFDLDANLLDDSINTVLVDTGINKPKNDKLEDARNIFDSVGGSLSDAAQQIANVMNNSAVPASKLKAAELILKVHGVLDEIEDKPAPSITININGSENKTLINLVLPTI